MSDKIEYSRLILKRSNVPGVIPTAPTGTTLNEFIDTDIFVGELFSNIADDKLWIRTDNGILEINVSGSTASIPDLIQVLGQGNSTGGYDIILNSGDTIQYLGLNSGTTSTILGLDNSGNTITTTIANILTPNLSEVLIDGNNTGSNDIILDDNGSGFTQSIKANNNIFNSQIGYEDIGGTTYAPLMKTEFNFNTNFIRVEDSETRIKNLTLNPTIIDRYGEVVVNSNSIQSLVQDNISGDFTSIYSTPSLIQVGGGIGFAGIQYQQDYSTNFTNRSLVDKGYVDTTISASTPTLEEVLLVGNTSNGNNIIISSGDTITYSGLQSGTTSTILGLDGSGNTITTIVNQGLILTETVGTITDTIEVDVSVNYFGTGVRSVDSSTGDEVLSTWDPTQHRTDVSSGLLLNQHRISAGQFISSVDNATDVTTITQDPNSIVIQGIGGNFNGIIYGNDYSSNFTNRSLVDKEYVVNSILGYTPTLNQVLTSGNTTGGKDIILSNGDTIQYLGLNSGTTSTFLGLDNSGNTITSTPPTPTLEEVLLVGNTTNDSDIIIGASHYIYNYDSTANIRFTDWIRLSNTDGTVNTTFGVDDVRVFTNVTDGTNLTDMSFYETNINLVSDNSVDNSTGIYIDPTTYELIVGDYNYTATDYSTLKLTDLYTEQKSISGNITSKLTLDPQDNMDVTGLSSVDNVTGAFGAVNVRPTTGVGIEGYDGGTTSSSIFVQPSQVLVQSQKQFNGIGNGVGKFTYFDTIETTGSTSTVITQVDLTGLYLASRTCMIKCYVTGIKLDGSKGYSNELNYTYRYYDVTPTLTLVGTADSNEKTEFTTATSNISTSFGTLIKVNVVGETSTTIYWSVTLEIIG